MMHFSDEEFQEAFQMLDAEKKGTIEKKQIFELLTAVYGFEPMPEEVDLFVNQFKLGEEGTLTWEEFHQGITVMREKLSSVTANAKEYTSVSHLHTDRIK